MLQKIFIISGLVVLFEFYFAVLNTDGVTSSQASTFEDGVENELNFLEEEATIDTLKMVAMPDFTTVTSSTDLKKQFFDFLRPIVKAENSRIHHQRNFVIKSYIAFQKGWQLNEEHQSRLLEIRNEYKMSALEMNSQEDFQQLLMCVDEVPESMALVQAAVESAWGKSYFATEGNNLFGQWCFNEGCGLVPRNRPEGATHEVRVFGSVNEAVMSYMRNLNTHAAYTQFRNLRYDYRQKEMPLDSYYLVLGLQKYSAKGMDYIKVLRSMLRSNNELLVVSADTHSGLH